MSDHDSLAERGRALEEDYFRKKDRELIDKLRRASEEARVRSDLSKSSGITDQAMLTDLLELGLDADTVSLLPLVPVVELAWAEGGITPAERQLVLSLARSRGIAEGSPADLRLNGWMDSRPSPEQLKKATRVMSAVLGSDTPVAKDLTADQLVKYCEQIASASGGLFGLPFRAVSMEEQALLARIAGDLKGPKK